MVGDSSDDSVRVYTYYYGRVWVWDYTTGTGGWFYGVNKVWVSTGNGDDYVDVDDYYGYYYGPDICVDTGNGEDSVNLFSGYTGRDIDINTGNGEDYVYSYSYYSAYYGGSINIDTENGDDYLYLRGYYDSLDLQLGRGDDEIAGYAYYCYGTVDGDKGYDTCSRFYVYGGSLDVMNCED